MTLLPQTPHESILFLNNSEGERSKSYTFTFQCILPIPKSSFKFPMSLLMRTRSSAYSNSLTTFLLAFSVIMSTTLPCLALSKNRDSVENKPTNLLVGSLGKTINRMPLSLCGRQMVGVKQSTRHGAPSLTEDLQTKHEC